MEFVSVRAWVFGEVKVIRKPISAHAPSPKPLDIMDTAMTVDNDRMEPTPSMSQTTQKKPVTENVPDKHQSLIKSCVVSIEPLKGPDSVTVGILSNNGNGYNMHNRPPNHSWHTKLLNIINCEVIDYSKFMSGKEEDSSPAQK